jgi:uncharacterized membrane protein HdeD (DUF308 family)
MVTNRYGRLLALRGGFAVLFGLVALLWPGVTAIALALVFGAYAFVDGIAMLVESARRRTGAGPRVPYVVGGVAGIAIGLAAFFWPQVTALALAILVGIWALVTGAIVLWLALRRRGRWLTALAGAASVVAGVLVLLRPDAGAVAIAQVIGVYAVVAGVLMLAESWRGGRTYPVRRVSRSTTI